MVIPRFIDQALAGESLTVYDDGSQVRCFAHVREVVDAIIRLMERNLPLSVWADRRETQPMRTQQRMMTANAELKS
jgi:nucleoside-diphosphate-sugar epimerase